MGQYWAGSILWIRNSIHLFLFLLASQPLWKWSSGQSRFLTSVFQQPGQSKLPPLYNFFLHEQPCSNIFTAKSPLDAVKPHFFSLRDLGRKIIDERQKSDLRLKSSKWTLVIKYLQIHHRVAPGHDGEAGSSSGDIPAHGSIWETYSNRGDSQLAGLTCVFKF